MAEKENDSTGHEPPDDSEGAQQSSGASVPPIGPTTKKSNRFTVLKKSIFFAVAKSIDELLLWTANHWWFEVVVFTLAFAVVVLKPGDIQNSFLALIPAQLKVTVFWLAVLAWAASFGARKRSESKVSAANKDQATQLATAVGGIQQSASDLNKSIGGVGNTAAALDKRLADAAQDIDKILTAVETLPHATFRQAWMDQAFDISALATSFARRDDLEKDQLASMIRIMLAAIAKLAKAYDEGSTGAYAANVMFFVPTLKTDPFIEHEIWKAVRFKAGWWDSHKDLVDGVLLLKKELSAATSNALVPNIQHDIGFIAATKKISNKWRGVLPGGPWAFSKGIEEKSYTVHGYDDVSAMGSLNQEGFDIVPDVLKELKSYYSPTGEGKDVKSFFAVTLPRRHERTKTPLGVINVHSSLPDILGGDFQRYTVFGQLIAPFVTEISWAAELWAMKAGVRLERLEG